MPREQLELLIEFTKDEDPRTRATAIAGLAKVADPRGFAPVVVGMFDPVDEVRVAAAVSLGVMRQQRAFEPLSECLTDSCEQVAINCAWALGQVEDPRCVERLIDAALDEALAPAVRVAAATAIGERAQLEGSDVSSQPQLAAIAQVGLLKAMECGIDELSACAIWSLGHFVPTKEVADACLAALESDHEWTVRYAIEALAAFEEQRALPLLEGLLSDSRPAVAELAKKARASLGKPQ